MDYEWDPGKAEINLRQHDIDFADAVPVFGGGSAMKAEYDFSEGKRGAVDPLPASKIRITIRLDNDILTWFREQVHLAGGGNYQTLINQALREYVQQQREPLEDILRRVMREELSQLK